MMIITGTNDSFTLPAHPMSFDWGQLAVIALWGFAVLFLLSCLIIWRSKNRREGLKAAGIFIAAGMIPWVLVNGLTQASWVEHIGDSLKEGTDVYASAGGPFSGWYAMHRSELDRELSSRYGVKLATDTSFMSPELVSLDGKKHFDCSLNWRLSDGEKDFIVEKPQCVQNAKLPKG